MFCTESEITPLREIDRERTARAQADKQLEQLRGRLAETERNYHEKLLEANAAQTRLAAELDNARAAMAENARAGQAQATELQQALQAAVQYKAQADTLRALVEQFRPAQKLTRKKRGSQPPEGQ